MDKLVSQPLKPLLAVDHLSVELGRRVPRAKIVHDVSFNVMPGEKVALVGESGSGKSVSALSVLRLHETGAVQYPSGAIHFNGCDLLKLDDKALRAVRGKEIGMIFQEPMTSLNPVQPIGAQLIESLRIHENMTRSAAKKRMLDLLERTGISEPGKRFDAFPHMLSGGQRQRVMIAMALACHPKLLVADEPTTALDVTIQAQIVALLEDLQREFDMAVLLITHDLGMVRRFAERVYVMQQGTIVESGDTDTLFSSPQHAYTRRLLDSQPGAHAAASVATAEPLLEARDVRCVFPVKAGFFRRTIAEVRAVDGVSFHVGKGETVGIVGESGSGKTTLGMCVLRLERCAGEIRFDGASLNGLTQRQIRPMRRSMQVVFQDPFSSLSPRMTVEDIVGEGLKLHFAAMPGAQRLERIVAALEEVGLKGDMLDRYPHQFSGGQRQRIAIARVLVLEPKLLLLDEPTSALDVSVQKQVLDLLRSLQSKHGMSYLFISHDLNVIRSMAQRILVMRAGKIVEQGEAEQLFNAPTQPYTRELLSASLFRTADTSNA